MGYGYLRIRESTFEIMDDLLRRSIDLANNTPLSGMRGSTLETIALILTKIGKLADLKRVLSQVKDRVVCIELLKTVGIELAREGYYDLALKIIEDISVDMLGMDIINGAPWSSVFESTYAPITSGGDLLARDELLKTIAIQASKNNDLHLAEKTIMSIITPYIRAEALGELALAYCKVGMMLEGIRRFIASLDMLDKMEQIAVSDGRVYDLNVLSKSISLRGNLAFKVQVAGFRELSRELINNVLESLANIYDDKYRLSTLISIIRSSRTIEGSFDDMGLTDYAVNEAKKTDDNYYKALLLKEVALHHHKHRRLGNFIMAIRDAVNAAFGLPKSHHRDKLLREIAMDCLRVGIFGCPRYLADKISDEKMRTELLCDISAAMIRKGYSNFALELIEKVQKTIRNGLDETHRAQLLGKIMRVFAQAGKYEKIPIVYSEFLQNLRNIRNSYDKVAIISNTALSILDILKKNQRCIPIKKNIMANNTGIQLL